MSQCEKEETVYSDPRTEQMDSFHHTTMDVEGWRRLLSASIFIRDCVFFAWQWLTDCEMMNYSPLL